MVSDRKYYVYLKFDLQGVPRYIGKGFGKRMYGHEYSGTKNRQMAALIAKARALGTKLPTVVLMAGLSEDEALENERVWIATIGRQTHGGTLFNWTDGGEGVSGLVHSIASRAKMSAAAKGRARGAPSQETRKKIALANTGKTISPEAKAKAAQSRQAWTVEERAAIRSKLSVSHLGHAHPLETRKKMSESAKRNAATPEWRARRSAQTKASWENRRKMKASS